jgi:hypothetical protein
LADKGPLRFEVNLDYDESVHLGDTKARFIKQYRELGYTVRDISDNSFSVEHVMYVLVPVLTRVRTTPNTSMHGKLRNVACDS